jgi:hypothetical protein
VGDGFDPYTIKGSVPLYTNNNQGIFNTPGSGYTVNRSNTATDLAAVQGGKIYLEFTVNDPTTPGDWRTMVGVGTTIAPGNATFFLGSQPDHLALISDGTVWSNLNQVIDLHMPLVGAGEVIGLAINAGNIWFRINNGPWNGDAANSPVNGVGGVAIPAGAQHYMTTVNSASISVNTAGPFAYPPPSDIQFLLDSRSGHQEQRLRHLR